jgi:hypothetical protein
VWLLSSCAYLHAARIDYEHYLQQVKGERNFRENRNESHGDAVPCFFPTRTLLADPFPSDSITVSPEHAR